MSLSPASESLEVVLRVHGSALGAHPGAELAGTVIDASHAAREMIGQKVLVPRLLPCGSCSLCQRSRIAHCPQLHRFRGPPQAEVRVPARFLLPLEPPLYQPAVEADALWRYAALSDALAAPHAGLLRAGIHTGELCVIYSGPGTGFRAAAALLVLKALGCPAVVLSAEAALRERLLAAPYDALAALDPATSDDADLRAALRELATGAGVPDHGLCLLETTGTDAGRARALALVERGGTVVLLDRMHQPQGEAMPAPLAAGPQLAGPATLAQICEDQCSILGAGAPHPDLLPELVALLRRAGVDLDPLVTPIAPQDIDAALAQRRRGEAPAATLPIVRYL